MRLIRHADLKPLPWKNGGGITREVAIFPPGADMNGFLWRVSMAQIASDGPFSIFPGVDRILYLLSGGGLGLRVAGRDHALRPGERLDFPADAAAEAWLQDGPVEDLNIMVDRSRVHVEVREQRIDGDLSLQLPTPASILFVREGEVSVPDPAGTLSMGPRDSLVTDDGDGPMIRLTGEGTVLLIAFTMRDTDHRQAPHHGKPHSG